MEFICCYLKILDWLLSNFIKVNNILIFLKYIWVDVIASWLEIIIIKFFLGFDDFYFYLTSLASILINNIV